FTNCEVALSPNACVIMDRKPHFLGVDEILRYNAFHTKDLFQQELGILLDELEGDWHWSSLEKIFFEQKVYRILENDAASWEEQLKDVEREMGKYQHLLRRPITSEDIAKLVEKPVRKISRFDIKAAEEKIRGIEADIEEVKNNLEHLTEFTIRYFQQLKRKYGARFPRKTEISTFENIQAEKVITLNAKLYANKADGFVGTDPKKIDGAEYLCDCSDIAEIVVFMKNGKYVVTKVKDKAFIGKDIIHAAVFNRKDERTVYNVVYRDGKPGGVYYAKRFAITGITRDKEYDLTQGKPGSTVLWFTANSNGEAEVLRVQYRPRPKLKKLVEEFDFAKLAIKGRASRGNVVTAKNSIHRITLKAKGVSTLAGKQIWLDEDIVRLNDAGRGRYLGEFSDGDLILVLCKDGTYYTTGFDLSTHFQGDLMRVEKFDPEKTFSALYYDGPAKAYYIKRFSFEPNAGIAVLFIAEGKGSKLLGLSEDRWPQLEVTFKGKSAGKEPERIDVEQFIGKKGFRAKGKKVSSLEVKSVQFIEPLVKEEPEEEEPDLPEEPDTPDEPDTPTVPDIGTDTPAEPNWSNPDEPTLF
ncbi:MAG: DNA gyrase/topoisomerase IV subunit A, partial [Bacteroidales bacterium]|nr:DNA gyrase/topoisomerase IV subunit A [Bacteroidales bacterium]